MGRKDRSTIGDNQRRKTVLAPDVISKQLGCCEGILLLGTWDKYCFFGESINDHQNIVITEGFGYLGEIYRNILPGTLRCRQR